MSEARTRLSKVIRWQKIAAAIAIPLLLFALTQDEMKVRLSDFWQWVVFAAFQIAIFTLIGLEVWKRRLMKKAGIIHHG